MLLRRRLMKSVFSLQDSVTSQFFIREGRIYRMYFTFSVCQNWIMWDIQYYYHKAAAAPGENLPASSPSRYRTFRSSLESELYCRVAAMGRLKQQYLCCRQQRYEAVTLRALSRSTYTLEVNHRDKRPTAAAMTVNYRGLLLLLLLLRLDFYWRLAEKKKVK